MSHGYQWRKNAWQRNISQASSCEMGLKQLFSLWKVVLNRMWRENKDYWEERDSEEWYPSSGSRATDWCFDVHNLPAFFYSVTSGIRALMTGVQCAQTFFFNFYKKMKTLSQASLDLAGIYLKNSVCLVFTSSLQLNRKLQVPRKRKQELNQMSSTETYLAWLSSLLGLQKKID